MKITHLIATVLLAVSQLSAAQNLKSVQDQMNATSKKSRPVASYLVEYGKILSKQTPEGWTNFDYTEGNLTREILPGGIIGTYLYETNGRFEGVAYSNGQKVSAVYGKTGNIEFLEDGSPTKVRIKRKMIVFDQGNQTLASFATIQESLHLLLSKNSRVVSAAKGSYSTNSEPICYEGDTAEICVVTSPGGGGGDNGGGGGGGGEQPCYYNCGPGDDSGGGGGGGGGGGEPDPMANAPYCVYGPITVCRIPAPLPGQEEITPPSAPWTLCSLLGWFCSEAPALPTPLPILANTLEEEIDNCMKQYDRDMAECEAYYGVYGSATWGTCKTKAGAFLGQCMTNARDRFR